MLGVGLKGFDDAYMVGIWAYGCEDRFPLPTAGRTIKVGLYSALAFGFAQDALGLARGRRLQYVDFLLGKKHNDMGLEEAIL